ncbi:BMP family lipoprotein [Methanoregula formicica]|uniref:Putative ABC-type transport system, periplasmic component/surface lipoprotein n=1 Tax=Methanoregula formicica (strain DSM 22288 / NBRC 105244 / SMSP) TaxID=593750 RepID=L0HIK5_METFS|nr:BMP family ABC transporter substrate-binding protein [Methanoregula formicica]AGB03138.1 putative ABC-type transport system, periplasmic component/surface lipoprotein [Methanoregula formicica SMSP]
MKPGSCILAVLTLLALLLIVAGCSQPAPAGTPVVWIVYGSEKGDLSYTDAAYQGLLAAQQKQALVIREFVPQDFDTLPAFLNASTGADRPALIITVGFQYAGFTKGLADLHKDIRFLAIDQAGIGSDNLRAYEITSYGDSYLAGVLAASASRTQHVGIIMGTESDVLDTFLDGYTDGARAVNATLAVDHAYVRHHSTEGFTNAPAAQKSAEAMYRNGTDVIFACAGYSNTGVFGAAENSPGRYVIGTDSDQSPLGPEIILASAVKRVDRVVSAGIRDTLDGEFTGGNVTAGLGEGVTGIIFNPRFESYNESLRGWETQALAEEREYLKSRARQSP